MPSPALIFVPVSARSEGANVWLRNAAREEIVLVLNTATGAHGAAEWINLDVNPERKPR